MHFFGYFEHALPERKFFFPMELKQLSSPITPENRVSNAVVM